jgi:hypothetical protein
MIKPIRVLKSRLKQNSNLERERCALRISASYELDMILLTNNTREFERVQGLKLENWVNTV